MANEYRPSASVILAYETKSSSNTDCDYEVLLCKRTPATSYFVDHCVFPGGCFELEADESKEWLEYFAESGITHDRLRWMWTTQGNRPHPLLTSGRNFTRDISLRLTAIRETFEEAGILLCRKQGFDSRPSGSFGLSLEIENRAHWQQEVHKDARKFIQLCRHFKIVPDIWALQEWSMWRSPATAVRKFDTVFFFVALTEKPTLLLEKSEIEDAMWYRPAEALLNFKKRNIWLPRIQFYEFSRLTNAPNLRKLMKFCRLRSQGSLTILMPADYKTKEKYHVGTLTGDDFYPSDPTMFDDGIAANCSYDEFKAKAKKFHRIIIFGKYDLQIESNIPPIDGHLSPLPKKQATNKL